jgi:hypothetical protein
MSTGEASASPSTASFIQSLMETDLYSIGAFFCDQDPQPVDEGLRTLLTGLAVRYYKAAAG